jgi:hypothetical protein
MRHAPAGGYLSIDHAGTTPGTDSKARILHRAARRTFSPAVDWTVNRADTLVLYVRGKSTNKPATLYLSIYDPIAARGVSPSIRRW